MARKQIRKLFPAITATNQTVDCEPYNCEPFPDYYYFPPPPPPPPSLSGAAHSNPIHHISPYLIISFSFLASVLVLVCYYVVIARSCPAWCSSRRNNNGPAPSQSDGTDQDFLDDQTQVDHPIWFITTVGLQQSVISSIAVCKYKKNEGLIEGTECSVCLNEFQENETLRLLPKCSHAFHIPCIDTWLGSHTNCPLCRANIMTDNTAVSLDNIVDQNSNDLNINEESTHMINSGNDQSELRENRAGAADEGDDVFRAVGDSRYNIDDCVPMIQRLSKDGRRSSMHRLMGSHSSIEQCLHIRPLSMKRSFSSGGTGRVLSLRYNRSQSSIDL